MHDSSSSLFLYIHGLSSVTIVLAYRLSLAELFLHSSLNSPRIQCYFVSPVPLEVLNRFNIFLRSKFTGLILLHQILLRSRCRVNVYGLFVLVLPCS